MRLAWLCLICCASTARVREPATEPLDPPTATFRWALDPVTCTTGDLRSTVDTCQLDATLVAVYTPVDDRDARLSVIRYDDRLGGPLRWQRQVDVGAAPHSAVVTIVDDVAIVAAISDGAARVAAIDIATGTAHGIATVVERGALAVQVEGIDDYARVHVRIAGGGTVAVVNPRTSRVVATREVPERAIHEDQATHPLPYLADEEEDFIARVENQRLVVRRGTTWMRYLRVVGADHELRLTFALVPLADRVIAIVHYAQQIEVVALDGKTGAPIWRSRMTGTSFDAADVREHVDGDQLVISAASTRDRLVCTIGIADGVERACVDRSFENDTVFDFGDDVIVTP